MGRTFCDELIKVHCQLSNVFSYLVTKEEDVQLPNDSVCFCVFRTLQGGIIPIADSLPYNS